ncbi:MAG TPA: PGF-pre-PGF domain-containing protein, partial [Candidatus Nanoarchaeia archaeon]|nr:PGF-pre-PGF domain-containing protein [Candidatus Nanoarchaeia archaeon]
GNNDVALYHYADDKWGQLATTVGQDDGTYVHYSAKTPGFSYFVIGKADVGAEPSLPADGSAPVVDETGVEAGSMAGEEAAGEAGGMTAVVVVLVVLAVVIVGWVVMRKRK